MKRKPIRTSWLSPKVMQEETGLISEGLIVSLTFFVVVAAVAQILRFVSRKYASSRFQRIISKEFLSAVEVTCSCYEFGTVIRNDGLGWFSAILFLLIVWRKVAWQYPEDGVLSFCPCNDITQLLKQNVHFPLVVAKNVADVFASPVAYRFCLLYWNMGLRPGHADIKRRTSWKYCVSEIEVNLGSAMMTEAVGTLFLCLLWSWIRRLDLPVLASYSFGSMASVAIVDAAMPYTGGYFSPSLASAKMWGCRGSSTFEHVMTYWVAPIATEMAFEMVNERYARREVEDEKED